MPESYVCCAFVLANLEYADAYVSQAHLFNCSKFASMTYYITHWEYGREKQLGQGIRANVSLNFEYADEYEVTSNAKRVF